MRFRRSQDEINVLKVLTIVIIVLFLILGLAGTDIIKSSILVLMLAIALFLVMIFGGDFDWIEIDERGIKVVKLLDILKRNGKQHEYTWNEITDISVWSSGRGGWGVTIASGKESFIFSFKRESYDYIKQHYPDIKLRNVNIK